MKKSSARFKTLSTLNLEKAIQKAHLLGFEMIYKKTGKPKTDKSRQKTNSIKTMKKLFSTTILISIFFAFQTNAQALFLKIGGTGVGGSLIIQGDVVTPASHANEILINSYQEGTGAGCTLAGDCSPATQSELVVTTMLDKSFMPLRQALLNHTIFNLKVSQVATGVDNLIINLDDAMITGISLSSGGDTPSISISISSPKWQHKYIA